MSNNLNIPDIASGQANKYLLANEQKAALDAAITDLLEVDTSGGPVSVNAEDYQRHVFFRVSGGDEVTLPAIRRMVAVEASGADCTLVRGSTTVALTSGDIGLIYTDGSSDGLVQVGGTGGPDNLGVLATFDMSGGADGQYVASDGNGGAELRDVPESGVEEAPQDGSGYERKDGGWAKAPFNVRPNGRDVEIGDSRADVILNKYLRLVGGSEGGLVNASGGATVFYFTGSSFDFRAGDGEFANQTVLRLNQNGASQFLRFPFKATAYTVATLPSSPGEGAQAYATDGRKAGEASGSGTGVPVYYSGGWKATGTDQAVEA